MLLIIVMSELTQELRAQASQLPEDLTMLDVAAARIDKLEAALRDIKDKSVNHSQSIEWAFYALVDDS